MNSSVGEILRRERLNQKRELAEIAEELCIARGYLRAIEEDDLKSLPGSFFYKSFVKQYAGVLGIDEGRLQPGVDAATALAYAPTLPGADARPLESFTPEPRYSNSGPASAVRQIDPI